MRKYALRAATLAAAALALSAAGYLAATSSWFITAVVLPRVSALVGFQISAAEVSLSLWNGSISAKGLKVDGPDGKSILAIRSLDAKADLARILKGEIAIGPVALADGTAAIAQGADGGWNVAPPRASGGAGKEPPRASAADGGAGPVVLDIAGVTIRNMDVDLAMEGLSPPLRLRARGLMLDAPRFANGAAVECSLRAALEVESGADIAVSTGALALDLKGRVGADFLPENVEARLSLPGLSGALHGVDMAGRGIEIAARAAADASSATIEELSIAERKGAETLTKGALAGAIAFSPFDAKASYAFDPVSPEVLNFAGKFLGDYALGRARLACSGTLSYGRGSLRSEGRLELANATLSRAGQAAPFPVTATLAHTLALDMGAKTAAIQELNLAVEGGGRRMLSLSADKGASFAWGGASPSGHGAVTLSVERLPLSFARPLAPGFPEWLKDGALDIDLRASASPSGLSCGGFAKAAGLRCAAPFLRLKDGAASIGIPDSSLSFDSGLAALRLAAASLELSDSGRPALAARLSGAYGVATGRAEASVAALRVEDTMLEIVPQTLWGAAPAAAALAAALRPLTLVFEPLSAVYDGKANRLEAAVGAATLSGAGGVSLRLTPPPSFTSDLGAEAAGWRRFVPSPMGIALREVPPELVNIVLGKSSGVALGGGTLALDAEAAVGSGAETLSARRVRLAWRKPRLSVGGKALALGAASLAMSARIGEDGGGSFAVENLTLAAADGGDLLALAAEGAWKPAGGGFSLSLPSLSIAPAAAAAISALLPPAAAAGLAPLSALPPWTLALTRPLALTFGAGGLRAEPAAISMRLGSSGSIGLATAAPLELAAGKPWPDSMAKALDATITAEGLALRALLPLMPGAACAPAAGKADARVAIHASPGMAGLTAKGALATHGTILSASGRETPAFDASASFDLEFADAFSKIQAKTASLSLSHAGKRALALSLSGAMDAKAGSQQWSASIGELTEGALRVAAPFAPQLAGVRRLACSGPVSFSMDSPRRAMATKIDLSLSEISLDPAVVKRELPPFKGVLSLDGAWSEGRHAKLNAARIDLSADGVRLADLRAAGHFDAVPGGESGSLRVSSEGIDLMALQSLMAGGSAPPGPEASRGGKAPLPAPIKPPTLPSMAIALDLKRLAYGPHITMDVKATGRTAPRRATVERMEASINGAPLNATFDAVFAEEGVRSMTLACDLERFDLSPVFKGFAPPDMAKGEGMATRLTAKLSSEGRTGPELLANLSGPATLRMADIAIPNPMLKNPLMRIVFLPIEALANISQYLPKGMAGQKVKGAEAASSRVLAGLESERIVLKSVELEANCGGGTARVPRFDVKGDGALIRSIQMTGSVGLAADGALNLVSDSDIAGLELPLTIKGTIQNPKPDYAKFALEFPVKNTANVLEGIASKLNPEDAANILRGGKDGWEALGKSVMDGVLSLPARGGGEADPPRTGGPEKGKTPAGGARPGKEAPPPADRQKDSKRKNSGESIGDLLDKILR